MKQSWIEEFERKYNKPKIEPIIVGFSGIDPQLKGINDEAIDDEIWKRLQEIEIRIDSGNIDPEAPEPPP